VAAQTRASDGASDAKAPIDDWSAFPAVGDKARARITMLKTKIVLAEVLPKVHARRVCVCACAWVGGWVRVCVRVHVHAQRCVCIYVCIRVCAGVSSAVSNCAQWRLWQQW
jgi:hypothetical protein